MAMYNSQAPLNGFKLSAPASFKQMKEELLNNREELESNLSHPSHQPQQQLMRFRSAPSSVLANVMNSSGEVCENFSPGSSSPDADSIFTRFLNCSGGDPACSVPGETEERLSVAASERSPQSGPAAEAVPQQNEYTAASEMIYQSAVSNQNLAASAAAGIPFEMTNPITMESPPLKSGSGSSNLIRHSSSPAGLFSHLTFENAGYAATRGVGNFRAGNGSIKETTASSSRLKNQVSFSPRQGSSSGMLSQISEMGERIGGSSSDDGSLGNDNSADRCYISSFFMPSWDGLPVENFTGLKRVKDMNGKIPSVTLSNGQNGVLGNHASGLSQQFSFPKTPGEIAVMENFLQFQDSVPCKIRAKRGCATHPRSIAERIISGEKNPDQRTHEKITRAGSQHGKANEHGGHVRFSCGVHKGSSETGPDASGSSCTLFMFKQKPYLNSVGGGIRDRQENKIHSLLVRKREEMERWPTKRVWINPETDLESRPLDPMELTELG